MAKDKEQILKIIEDYKEKINQISNELIAVKESGLDTPEDTEVANRQLDYLYDNLERYERQAKVFGWIKLSGDPIYSEYDH